MVALLYWVVILLYLCRALLKLQHWQHWLLRLADQSVAQESGTYIHTYTDPAICMNTIGFFGV